MMKKSFEINIKLSEVFKLNNTGVIYILTNPSFPQYVKIGYANDLKSRLKSLNRSECIPFAFRVYAYYKVPKRLTDLEIHKIIDTINPNLRAIETIDGKERKREFYELSANDAYEILLGIAKINGMESNITLVEPTSKEIKEEEEAEEGRTKRVMTQLPRMDWLIEQGIVNIGDEVYIINHPDEVAVIKNAESVEHKGEVMSFNQFGCKITGWKAIQIYAYMKKVGEKDTLAELREEKMHELGMI
jgi:hypothetical protein